MASGTKTSSCTNTFMYIRYTYMLSKSKRSWSLLFLGINDLHTLQTLLKDVSYQWELIGLALHLLQPQLNILKADHLGEGQNLFLVAMLETWLQQNYNITEFGEPSWRMLVEALEGVDGCKLTANRIKEQKPWSNSRGGNERCSETQV